jgi:hypothetical protein
MPESAGPFSKSHSLSNTSSRARVAPAVIDGVGAGRPVVPTVATDLSI